MSRFLDPTGQPTYGIGLCGRCSRKMFLSELFPDPNSPGLRVCAADMDEYDPYRLAPRGPDQIVLPFTRPDTPLTYATPVIRYLTTESDDELITEDLDYLIA